MTQEEGGGGWLEMIVQFGHTFAALATIRIYTIRIRNTLDEIEGSVTNRSRNVVELRNRKSEAAYSHASYVRARVYTRESLVSISLSSFQPEVVGKHTSIDLTTKATLSTVNPSYQSMAW